jgi:hypothetical protein
MPKQQPNQKFTQILQPISSPLKPKFNLKYLAIILILLAIVSSGILYWFILAQSKIGEPQKEEVKYLTYRKIFRDSQNISFQYPSYLHLIENRQEISSPNVCTGGIPPNPGYAYYDMCQRRIIDPLISLISNEGKTIIEISDLNSNSAISSLKTLRDAFLWQYFPEISFDKEYRLPLEESKLPLNRSEGSEVFATIYRSSNPSAPVIAFIPAFGPGGGAPEAFVLILKDKTFEQAFDGIVKSFNLNNTAQLVEIDLANGHSTTLDSPLYIADLKFHDSYNQKMLLSDIEKMVIFDEKERTFTELFKFPELKETLKIDADLYSWVYQSDVVFDRTNPNIIYGLIGNTIFQYNVLTKEPKILFKGELPVQPFDLFPPVGKNLIIRSEYGDVGCFSREYSLLDLDNKKIKKGWSEGYCAEEENITEKSIDISPDGIYVVILSKRNDYSDFYLYNNLTGKKSLLWRRKIPLFPGEKIPDIEVEGWMISPYRFKFYDEKGNPKVYNLQSQKFESLSDLTTEALRPALTPLAYNENGFVYGEEKNLYYLDYMKGRLIPLYGIEPEKLLFLTNSSVFAWK